MTISAASIPVGATYAPTGGVATSFVSLGQTTDSHKLFLDDSSSFILRKTLSVTSKAPTPSSGAPNGYTQQRNSVVFLQPKLLANGNYTKNSIRVEVSYDPEASAAERAELREMLAHLGSDADFDNLFDQGSVA